MSKPIIQHHHITYPSGKCHPPSEWIVPVTKGEHFVITRLQWLKSLSDGARAAILYELALKPRREDG